MKGTYAMRVDQMDDVKENWFGADLPEKAGEPRTAEREKFKQFLADETEGRHTIIDTQVYFQDEGDRIAIVGEVDG